MSILMNIAAPNSQTAQNAQSGNGIVASSSSISSSSTNKIGSSEFGSLIATLLGLNAPTQTSNTKTPNVELKTQLQNEQEKQDPSIISSLADLLKSLEIIENSLKNAKPLTQDNIENALEAVNALLAQLETLAPSPIGEAVSALNTQLLNQNNLMLDGENISKGIAELANLFTNAKSLDAQNITAQTANLEIAKNIAQLNQTNQSQQIQNSQIQNSQSQNLATQEILQNLSPKEVNSALNQIVQKLSNIVGANQPNAIAELSQKLQQLTQKLGDVAPVNIANKQANSGALNNVASSPINEESAKSLLSLLGANTNPKANIKTDGTGTAKLDGSAVAFLNAQKTPITSQNNAPNIVNVEKANITPNQNILPNQAGITSLALVSNAVKIDANGQSEPILLAQNISNPNVNANFAANIKPVTALYQGAVQNLNLPHVAFEFARNLNAGLNRFQIRLDPPEMGRIDVKIDIDNSGNLNARLSVERAETLDLLQRDVRALERALAQAGIDSNKTNLDFSLKDNGFEQNNNQFANDNQHNGCQNDDAEQTSSEIISQMPNAIIYHSTASPGGINITA